MSKRELSKYLNSLSKKELETQIQELYDRLKEVREFYNFVFNPKEDKMVDEAKFKISKEYYPVSNRKPKRRRSVAQKHIRTFIKLGVDPHMIADVMLYNLEIAQAANADKSINQDSFYKSMLNSFEEALQYFQEHDLTSKFRSRIDKVMENTQTQKWINADAFEEKFDKLILNK